jgi:RHS repeat-associated protein
MVVPTASPSAESGAREQDTFRVQAPSLVLPKGGGAIAGIGEKFSSNPMTGTASLTVPIYTSPSRSGFGPKLTLTYDSARGNGAYGLGWDIELPSITRKTNTGLPQYRDAEDSDIFILSGAEDLVPVLVNSPAGWLSAPVQRNYYGKLCIVRAYRPRVEGPFARIERWSSLDDASDVFWRSISTENVTTWYGLTAESRIVDPVDATRIFSWLISQSHDDKGNLLEYRYKPEDSSGIDTSQLHERNRTQAGRGAGRYPRSIRYGHRTPYSPRLDAAEQEGLPGDPAFELVFDYGEYDPDRPASGAEVAPWEVRPDPFSTYRPGFDVRTYRRCKRLLMFHHFADQPGVGADCLVRSTGLAYADVPADTSDPFYSLLTTITRTGYRRQGGGYLLSSMPALTLGYSTPEIDETVGELDPQSLRNLPSGIDGPRYRWLDLDGEGLSGILTEQGGGWFYKANISPVTETPTLASFGPVETVGELALRNASAGSGRTLASLTGNGHLDLVDYEGPAPGFAERTFDGGWAPWARFASLPVLDWGSPYLRFIDLTGDGLPDLLIAENDALTWHASLGQTGFADAERVAQALDEEQGPRLLFADTTESIFLADMSGDGLTDLVRVRNGEACYWPNKGYGRFGAKVSMDNAPWFDPPDLFSGRRIRLADLDGSGTADIVYFASRGTQLHFNLSGNGFGAPRQLAATPSVDALTSAQAIDLLGNGTSCLVWSSPLPGQATAPLRWVDLMSGRKPHLLTRIDNNMGSETIVTYAPSTRFYVADKLAGTPWLTRVPFPVQVVERIELRDWIGRNRFLTRYAYHHGYFDGIEREFRGFGRVEQWDTGEFGSLKGTGSFPNPANEDAASFLPPICTRTWFHTGAYIEEAGVSRHFAAEYYQEPSLGDAQRSALLLPDTALPTTVQMQDDSRIPWTLASEEAREAARALRGSILRREVYAEDGTGAAARPYTATERNYTIELLQPQGRNPYAVFSVGARETLDLQYERATYNIGGAEMADPRVRHTLTLAADPFGNVLLAATASYGRRHGDSSLGASDQAVQAKLLLTSTENRYTAPALTPDGWRTPLAAERRAYELLRCVPRSSLPDVTNLFRFDELAGLLAQAGDGAHDLPYEDVSGQGAVAAHPYRRLVERSRTLYLADDLSAVLPLGQVGQLGLIFEHYRLALTPGLAAITYGPKLSGAQLDAVLAGEARYRDLDGDGNHWAALGRSFYSPDPNAPDQVFAQAHFYLVQSIQDPFGNATQIGYDGDNLLVATVTDALGNQEAAQNDYRVLQPAMLTDPNGNRTVATFDALGLVAGTAIMGKASETLGDSLDGFAADLTPTQIAAFADAIDAPGMAAGLLAQASTRVVYDLQRFAASRAAVPADPASWQPVFAATISRETHVSDLEAGQSSRLQLAFQYSDGFGRGVQIKRQAEPAAPGGALRWIGSGWTIFDNKGNPVRQFEPFFSALPDRQQRFEFGLAQGVSPIVARDPLGRAVATVRPNQSWEKVVLDPWQSQAWDVNDTVLVADPRTDADVGAWLARLPANDLLPTWHQQRIGGALGAAAQQAAQAAELHAATPGRAFFDPLERRFLSVADNGADGQHLVRSQIDVQGNLRATVDELGRLAASYDYDVLGARIRQASMEAGERRVLNDAMGQALRSWDSRGHAFRSQYDALRRPTGQFVLGTDPAQSDPRTTAGEVQYGKWEYGEGMAGASALNLRTRVYQRFDQAGVETNRGIDPLTGLDQAYDFKGNKLARQRQLVRDYIGLPDWSGAPVLGETFLTLTRYDALNRPIQVRTPDASVTTRSYDASGLLQRIAVTLQGSGTVTDFVTGIVYNARGQRTAVAGGNGALTAYDYDPLTFRLMRLTTTRSGFSADQSVVQLIGLTDDPVGNITHIQDDADIQNTIYFRNRRVDPSADYRFDPLYRLVRATGREHLGQLGSPALVPGPPSYNDQPRVGLLHPGDGNAMGTYTEQYQYDPAGNLLSVRHAGSNPANPGWTRAYVYAETSALQAAAVSNRLTRTVVSPQGIAPQTENYGYDSHGNMTAMPQLQAMQWDFANRLSETQRQAVNADDADGAAHAGERTFFVHDQDGQRVRKVTQRANGTLMKERIYLDGFEIYREYGGTAATIMLERQTLHVMDDIRRVALVETRTQGEDGSPQQLIRYQYGNHLGSACLELDGGGRVISYEEYAPYGGTMYQAVDSNLSTAAKRYRFTGMERDEETGLTYHGERYCASWLGRWVSCDPAGAIDGMNLYRYARDAPTTLTDRRGTDPQHPDEPPEKSDDDPPPDPQQANQQNSGFSASAVIPPDDTATSEFTAQGSGGGGSPGTSGAGSFLYHYRRVTAPGREFGLQLGFGGSATSGSPSVGTGTLVGTLHLGQEPDTKDLTKTSQNLTGWYFGTGLLWGQNPTTVDTFGGESRQVGGPNPVGSAQFAYSNIQSEPQGKTQPHLHQTSEFDLDIGLSGQRYGAVNNVTVTGLVQPSLVLNEAISDWPSDNWTTNFELGATGNLGLGGVVQDPTGRTTVTGGGLRSVPMSLTLTAGVGFTKTWGDYALSVEPYVQHEAFPNVASNGGTGSFVDGAWIGGIKIGFTGINLPHSRDVPNLH